MFCRFNGLRTANHEPRITNYGFTLIEVLIAAAILAIGVVGITRSYFLTMDLHRIYTDYVRVLPWIDEKIWQAQDYLTRGQSLEGKMNLAGTWTVGPDEYIWRINYGQADPDALLYQIHLRVQGARQIKPLLIERTAYALVP